jgi:isopentenyldiphosphate isomerase
VSKEIWLSISGPGFYVLFGVYFVFELYNKKVKQKKYINEEWLPMVNEEGRLQGKMPRSIAHNGSKILHPVVHMHVFNSDGELYLQKRPAFKLIQPNKWDTAVGGHIAAGESVDLSLKREAFEEIGLKDFEVKPFKQYVWESEVEREFVIGFVAVTNTRPVPDTDEVEEGRFWKLDEIEENIGKGIFTPNFEYEFNFLKSKLD